jgi:putative oxidoreductase
MVSLTERVEREHEVGGIVADAAVLTLRLGTGALLAGHGAQKLLGWFGGHGLQGTGMWLESVGLRPGKLWAAGAAAGEMGGGLLTALGLGGPLGPIGVVSAMAMATAKAHWGRPIWVTDGGAELPAVYSTTAAVVALAGPGRFSLDRALGIKVPWWLSVTAGLLAAATVAYGVMSKPEPVAGEGAPAEDAAEEENLEDASSSEGSQAARDGQLHPAHAAA